jgi:hypothetical protein
MSIVQCSLQCSDSVVAPGQVSCGITNVFVNQEIRVAFTRPIDPNSISTNSFRLIEVVPNTGKTPAGTFTVDAVDPRILIYRPQVTFDSSGNPIFGLNQDSQYEFTIPARGQPGELGPFITDPNGAANTTFLRCGLTASEDVRDISPGRPRATVFVRRVLGYDAEENPIVDPNESPAPGATNVWRESTVRIVFDDVMNPATLANPVTGQSSHIQAFIDADGNTADPSDQVAMNGTFTVTIDQRVPPSTTVVFTPAGGLPSSGRDLANPRKVVISLSPQIVDLGRNPIINPGQVAFEPERILFDPLFVTEGFADATREDSLRTGGNWGSGVLTSGIGGGSGRLGDLIIPGGTIIELNTDSEDFSSITNPAIFNPANIIERPPPPAVFTVEDGVFEFTRLRVDAGALLRFSGSNPARIYVRGVADIQGQIEVNGAGATLHASSSTNGGTGGLAGPNGGAGGRGGGRPNGSAFTGVFNGLPIGGVPTGNGPVNVLDPASYVGVNGIPGGGIAAPSTVDPNPSFVGGGAQGLGWPQPTSANPSLHMPQDVFDISGLQFDPLAFCEYPIPAAPGGGGGHAFDGGDGVPKFAQSSPVTRPPSAAGGDVTALAVDDEVRKLTPELGFLRGGGGGGGGGASVQYTALNGAPLFFDCTVPLIGTVLQIMTYRAHSAAGGGGGGGGLQVAAGRRLNLAGSISASGGDGGSGTFPPEDPGAIDLAQAGGGGAGGSVLLQSARIQIQAVPGRIDVSGGEGGEGTGDLSTRPPSPSLGGRGSPGLLRMESPIVPSVESEEFKVSPLESELQAQYGGQVTIEDIFTVGEWQPLASSPSSQNGAQSCWVRPTGNFFRLDFTEDSEDTLGWDMNLRIKGQPNPQSYRGANDVSAMTLEEFFGNEFGSAPLVVRFQGARAIDTLIDACSVPESGVSSPIAPGSLTEWLHHPGELNGHFADASLSSNMFRFIVIWDRSHPSIEMIEAVEDISVTIQPD